MKEFLDMAPKWARSLVGIVAALAVCLTLVPQSKIDAAISFLTQPPGIILLYAIALAVCMWLVSHVRELRKGLAECQEKHDRCEDRTNRLVAVVLDFAVGNKEAAVQEARKLMLE